MIFDFNKGFDNSESVSLREGAIIAVSAHIIDELSTLHFAYSQAIIDAGATPVIIPANCSAESLISLMSGVDALLLSGGVDIDARYFGEENIPDLTDLSLQRDYYEFVMLRLAIDRGLPIMGICRGCQVINVALGGSIYQDLPTLYDGELLRHSVLDTPKERAAHDIEIADGTMLRRIIGRDRMGVNTRHHQAIKGIAPSLILAAKSPDGVVEAVEGYPTQKIIALQCHPENMATAGGAVEMKRLFEFFVSEAELYHRAKRIHLLNPIVDSHCDTPMLYEQDGFNFVVRNRGAQVDMVKMEEGYVDATITVAYISQSTPADQATERALSTLRRFRGDVAGSICVAMTPDDVVKAKARGEKSVMLGVENGLAIGDDLSNIDLFKAEGVQYITLCHNGSNAICDSAKGEPLHGGVSGFGAEVIARMNSLGVTIDISHSSEQSTLDAIELSRQPIIASHSSCRALCDHPRNLSDSVIRAIAAKGGVVQVCGYGGFLSDSAEATIHTLVAHIEHVISLVGYDFVGVGSDFDGGGGVEGFSGSNHFMNLTIELLRRGHAADGIAKIMGGNIMRVLSQNSCVE